jgi:RNA polymerase sigma-70 factor (ECF subfamily)
MRIFYKQTAGDESERRKIAELYEKYRYDCIHTAMRIVKNSAAAEDAVQDAFVSVMRHKEKYLEMDCRSFRRSIVIIVKNKCIDLIRKNKHLAGVPLDDLAYTISSGEIPVDEQIINREEFERICGYLNELDEISRTVLQMKYLQGKSYKEIGDALGMTTKNVDVRLTRAKDKVRQFIRQEGETENE